MSLNFGVLFLRATVALQASIADDQWKDVIIW